MITKRTIVSLEEFPGELFMVVGQQDGLEGSSDLFVLMSADKRTLFRTYFLSANRTFSSFVI